MQAMAVKGQIMMILLMKVYCSNEGYTAEGSRFQLRRWKVGGYKDAIGEPIRMQYTEIQMLGDEWWRAKKTIYKGGEND